MFKVGNGATKYTELAYYRSEYADKLSTSRTISLSGSVTGSGSFDGSGNLSISTSTSHTHTKSQITDFPTSMKNPYAITFTGGVTGTYDGSSAKSVAIPTTLPASDVYSWAKASTKPTYTPIEVGVIETAPTSGQVAVFDGTTGKIKSTGFTISKSVPSDAKFTDTVYTHPSSTAYASGLYKITTNSLGHITAATAVTKSDIVALGIPSQDTNTTYSVFTAATASAAGSTGLVPSPAAGKQTSFLRGDGTWVIPTNTTYGVVSTSSNGLAPKLPGNTTTYLRGDGTYATPPNTTYSVATTSANGLMSSAMVTKLNGIADGANKYVLPTASSTTLGGVKTTSTTTSTSGLTACPIISGVPYYKDTNTTYTLSSFGVTATAAELNYCDGVTSNIQTQLNGKAASSHGTHVSFSSTAPLVDGTASVGSASTVARSDHRHPVDTSRAAASHTHSYLPLSGGTLTGRLTGNGKITLPSTAGSWITGMTLTNPSIGISTQQTTSSYHPYFGVKTSGGHVANIGGLGDNFGFYGFKSGRTENSTDWSFVINVGTGAITSTGSITAPTFSGNATSASEAATLTTARTINGTSFNGSANITTANWGTTRTITIGSTGKSVNGSGNVSWSLTEIGAAAASHGTHVSYGTSATALTVSTSGSAGSASTVSRSDHRHGLPSAVLTTSDTLVLVGTI